MSEVKSPVNWRTYDQGLAEARSENKLLLIQFYTSWCPHCKYLDAWVLGDAQIQQRLAQDFVPVRLSENDPTSFNLRGRPSTEAQWRYQIDFRGYPTHVILDNKEQQIYQFIGSRSLEDFARILDYTRSGAYQKLPLEQF